MKRLDHDLAQCEHCLAQLGLLFRGLLDRPQAEQDRGQRLACLVVQLPCEPLPLELLSRDDPAKRVARHALREIDCKRRALGEDLGDPDVLVAEPPVRHVLVVSNQDADCTVAEDQRNPEPRPGLDAADDRLIDLGVVDDRVHALASPTLQYTGGLRRARAKASPRRTDRPRRLPRSRSRVSPFDRGMARKTIRASIRSRRRPTMSSSSLGSSISVESAFPTSVRDSSCASQRDVDS